MLTDCLTEPLSAIIVMMPGPIAARKSNARRFSRVIRWILLPAQYTSRDAISRVIQSQGESLFETQSCYSLVVLTYLMDSKRKLLVSIGCIESR